MMQCRHKYTKSIIFLLTTVLIYLFGDQMVSWHVKI